MNKIKIFGQLNKSEQQDDGTLKVWGIASTGNLDSDGEIITADAMKQAIPDYMKFGAIREMHGSNAAGTALEVYVDSNGVTNLCALIVDPVAILKVQTQTYKGFSIGGKVLARNPTNKNEITGIKLVEISIVDRPANPEAVFTMYKSETIDNEQQNNDNIENIGAIMPQEENQEVNKDEVATPVVETPEVEIKKSLSDVSWLAGLVSELSWLQECMQSDSEWEKDGSKIPSELKAIISQLGSLLVASTAEEVAELTSTVADKSEDSKDLNKSEDLNKEIINQIYELALKLSPKEEVVKNESSEDLNKFENVQNDLQKALKLNEDLSKRVSELEAMPSAPKAVLHIANKEGDVEKAAVAEKVIKNAHGEVDEVATAILKAQRNPTFIKI